MNASESLVLCVCVLWVWGGGWLWNGDGEMGEEVMKILIYE